MSTQTDFERALELDWMTAIHEATHAVAAQYYKVHIPHEITIIPDPSTQRLGFCEGKTNSLVFYDRTIAEYEILYALAGPVQEALHVDGYFQQEWWALIEYLVGSDDIQFAQKLAAVHEPDSDR